MRLVAEPAGFNTALDSVIIAAVAVTFVAAAWFSATRAKRAHDELETQRIEAEAYQRVQGIYTSAIQVLEKRTLYLDSRNSWLERRLAQLERELARAGLQVVVSEPPPVTPDIPAPALPPLPRE